MKNQNAGPTGFVGMSHLGIVTSIGWTSFDRPIIGFDSNVKVIERLDRGDLPVHEPDLPELFLKYRQQINFTSQPADLKRCSLVIIASDVPTTDNNKKDLSPLYSYVETILPHLQEGVVLVVMSQVPPGFTRELSKRIQSLRPGFKFTLYYWVETLIFGRAVERTLKPERFIVGCEDPTLPLASVFEKGLKSYGCPILPMRYESAELTKTAINLYLINAVTYTNTLSDLCASLGGDWQEVVPALKLDARIGPAAYLKPSLGITGGNLERDLQTLKELCYERGVDATLIDSLISFNAHRYNWVLRQLREHVFYENSSPRLAVWGLTYKKNTHSMKNSPSVRLINFYIGVKAYDRTVKGGPPDTCHNAKVRHSYETGWSCILILHERITL